ncbi:hypothetical protein [Micromonospora echinofusca]|uniref:Ig-like domain-containing protein n=1 Tax=Micromonospora echinofusca TaxID=47858 RepID=A0ABS3VNT0_MICEH|nr:hypothetical protein [Micromonospora echinofusca]MBO4206199.1 hypothetical protein [Micromonospora echinofusca]
MLTALALAGLAGAAVPGPASASSPLVVQWSLCVATVGPYAGGLDCAAYATGGTAPLTYVWTPQYYPGSQWPVTGSSVRVGCNPGTWSTVALTVTDSAGRVAYGGGSDWCNIPGQDPL